MYKRQKRKNIAMGNLNPPPPGGTAILPDITIK
jgi:hypothetical protein